MYARSSLALFDAVARVLAAAALRHPLVLIVDDLHWADPPSLLRLQFVARQLAEVPMLIIGTYRETGVQDDLARGSAFQRIGAAHLALARRLNATVKCGYFCWYSPDLRHSIDWQT